MQATGLPPVHTPDWQVSVCVHALLSPHLKKVTTICGRLAVVALVREAYSTALFTAPMTASFTSQPLLVAEPETNAATSPVTSQEMNVPAPAGTVAVAAGDARKSPPALLHAVTP